MPAVNSKFAAPLVDLPIDRRTLVSAVIVGGALLSYGLKVAGPLLKEAIAQQADLVPLRNDATSGHASLVITPTRPQRHTAGPVPTLNLRFILQFIRLMRIMMPSVLSAEVGMLAGHTVFLFMRTFLSIYVANLEGAIVKYIVRREPANFIRQLGKWFGVAIPATFINSMIRYLESRVALRFRSQLVKHAHQLYFRNQSYYRVHVLDGRLDNCAQRLTDDIETIATKVSHLYGQITKPMFDILLMAVALANLVRSRNANLVTGPVIIIGVVALSALILRLVSPRFGQLVAEEAEKKGHLRHVHARIVANAEEIAFYGGHKVEQALLRNAYGALVQHLERMFAVKLWFVMLEQFLMKYVWSGAGMIVVSLPILLSVQNPQNVPSYNDNVAERTHYFTTAKNLLLTGSNAVERLMSSYKDVVELAGHTTRVATMFTVLEESSRGIYHKTVIRQKRKEPSFDWRGFEVEFKGNQPLAKGKWIRASPANEIELHSVPIVTPNCDVVCPSLSIKLVPGQHLLITGPNGCGKSSLFRILSGLWPIYGGTLIAPVNAMFYIPQRPYMVLGNLRDQIIYPDTVTDMINRQVSEQDLLHIMRMVHLEHIAERDGFHQIKDWNDILSGGEKQRMAVARLFYHRPNYALLDECTSAVSIDVESQIYQTAIDMGITLLTITHRPTLWKFHTHILQFDGTGSWIFEELNTSNRMHLRKQKQLLRLHSVPDWLNAPGDELSAHAQDQTKAYVNTVLTDEVDNDNNKDADVSCSDRTDKPL